MDFETVAVSAIFEFSGNEFEFGEKTLRYGASLGGSKTCKK
jgi:hypothetical protein